MKQQLDKNGCISINGRKLALFDERAAEGIIVDTDHLTEPDEIEGIDWHDSQIDKDTVLLQVRFKQPDMMEVVWEMKSPSAGWVRLEGGETSSKEIKTRYPLIPMRQIFILKEKEVYGLTKEQLLSETLQLDENGKFETVPVEHHLTDEYSMNEIPVGEEIDPEIQKVIDEKFWDMLPKSEGKNPYELIIECGLDGDYIHQEDVVNLMELYASQPFNPWVKTSVVIDGKHYVIEGDIPKSADCIEVDNAYPDRICFNVKDDDILYPDYRMLVKD